MLIDVEVGVQKPEEIDEDALMAVFPYGQPTIKVVKGGLDVPRPNGNPTVLANIAISVSFEMEAQS